MPTYTYRIVDSSPHASERTFELRQSINDPPLTAHPDTGEPVERVITGGLPPLTAPTGGVEPTITSGCGPTCGCH